MKKFVLSFLMFCLCCIGTLAFSGCGDTDNPPEHTHSFESSWSKNETHHWRACSETTCSEKTDNIAHCFDDGTVNNGKIIYTCDICGYTKEEDYVLTITEDEWKSALDDDKFVNVTVEAQILNGQKTQTKITEAVIHSVLTQQETYYHRKKVSGETYTSANTLAYHARQFDGTSVTGWHEGTIDSMTFEEYAVFAIQSQNIGYSVKELYNQFSYNVETGAYENNSDIIVLLDRGSEHPTSLTATKFHIYFENGYVSKIDFCYDIPDVTQEEKCGSYTYKNYGNTVIEALNEFVNLKFNLSNDETYYLFAGIDCEFPCYIEIPTQYNNLPVKISSETDWNGISVVKLPNNITNIPSETFAYSTLYGIDLPDTLLQIENKAFYCCSNLKYIEIPNNTQSIGDECFYSCLSLTNLIIPESVTYLGSSVFACSALKTILLPKNIKSISQFAFLNCTNLEKISIPENIEKIGAGAFAGCVSIKTIEYNAISCLDLLQGEDPFTQYSGTTFVNANVFVGEKVTRIPAWLFSASSIVSVEFAKTNSCTDIGTGAFFACANLKNIIIPKEITFIGKKAFRKCDLLEQIQFENVTDWFVLDGGNAVYLSPTDLSDLTVSIDYITDTYSLLDWKK